MLAIAPAVYAPMPGKFAQRLDRVGQAPIELGHDLLRRAVKVARSRIITQPFPQLEHIVERRLCQRLRRRKALGESLKVWYNCNHLCLLQHRLADPDAVWVARLGSPRQVAQVARCPSQ